MYIAKYCILDGFMHGNTIDLELFSSAYGWLRCEEAHQVPVLLYYQRWSVTVYIKRARWWAVNLLQKIQESEKNPNFFQLKPGNALHPAVRIKCIDCIISITVSTVVLLF